MINMKTIIKLVKQLKNDFFRLELVDRCLIVFMVILMAQIAANLFCIRMGTAPVDVDIIVRTTAASIFGYFLSGNFTRNAIPKGGCTPTEEKDRKKSKMSKQQIKIVFTFGVISLVLLLLARNVVSQDNPVMMATISQLRDFVSGSVGFLVGSPCTNNKGEQK